MAWGVFRRYYQPPAKPAALATLTKAPSGAFTLTADAGSYALTGTAATPTKSGAENTIP